MQALDLVRLTALMERTSGSRDVRIGLVDGPVATNHVDLADQSLCAMSGSTGVITCSPANRAACMHGTFIAGILSARRNSASPAICPNCTLLIHPIFTEATSGRLHMPSATPQELAAAIIACIDEGARVINLSLALERPSIRGDAVLEDALNQAMRRGVIVVAASGNQGTVGSSVITRHPWVTPVVACDAQGRPLNDSNLSGSIGRRGLRAPGEGVTSLSSEGQSLILGGTSVATPFVTGAIALLWSEFLAATAAEIKLAITLSHRHRKASVTPPLLDAWGAYELLKMRTGVS
jgi:subtilisin family serine protease